MPQQQITIDLRELKTTVCHCGNIYFDTVISYKLLSALASPNGQEQLISMQSAVCTKCKDVYSMEDLLKMSKGEKLVLIQ